MSGPALNAYLASTQVSLTTIIRGGHCCHPYFTDEETEVQEGEDIGQGFTASMLNCRQSGSRL